MIRTTRTALGALAVAIAFGACKGNAAADELEKVKEKTCSCKAEDRACLDEAKAMAKAWVDKHEGAPRGDVIEEITNCSLEVGLELN